MVDLRHIRSRQHLDCQIAWFPAGRQASPHLPGEGGPEIAGVGAYGGCGQACLEPRMSSLAFVRYLLPWESWGLDSPVKWTAVAPRLLIYKGFA